MRRVLATITAYPPSIGGAQIYLHRLLLSLPRSDPEVVAWWDRNRSDWLLGTTVRAPRHAQDQQVDGIPVHRLGLSLAERAGTVPAVVAYYGATAWSAGRLAGRLAGALDGRAQHADVVHCVRVGREPLALASEAVARRWQRPFVFTPLHHPRWVRRRHRVYLDLYRRADRLIALSSAERDALVDLGVSPDRVAVTGIGPVIADEADGPAFRRRHGIVGPMVLFLGQHFGYKGFRSLLAAAPAVWRRQPDTTFVFAGPPVGHSERAFTRCDPRVRRIGAVDLQTKTDALAACDVLCVPSLQESFGGVFTEAWSFGRPVVGGDTPAVRAVIDDGVDGFLVDQRPGTIADRLLWLLDRPDLAARMGSAGQRKVTERWSWQALAEATEQVYDSVT